ncbi:MAG: P-loop NTPase fold protein [Pantoea sp.]|uniref:KAP family P-loop NTPase fold protein n=1 Tax=Pantoea sp. TaxID=69393 RepID=UPI0039E26E88
MREQNSATQAAAGNDLPVTTPEEDRYGFVALAESLSRSIIALDDNVSTVIGIEGPWGSGKTSLLNLLRHRMERDRPEGTYVLQVSPWLSPDGGCTVENLLIPVADILNRVKQGKSSWPCRLWHRLCGSKASALATDVVRYAQQASGRLAPLAELAGNFIPGAGIVASSMKTLSSTDLSAGGRTADALRDEIEKEIASLGLNFIVVLDDLDRLEPAQAVEVLRLVRSVADFSRFRYVMCYDPVVLGHAVKRGLGVADGQHYLQKIVQLPFPLPRHESFDLRREFFNEAVKIYMNVSGREPDKTLLTDLKDVANTFGATLSTPREVRLALSALAFRYPPLREFCWFPDLCLLQLLRVTLPEMYYWIEHYLTEQAAVDSGEGQVSGKEKAAMSKALTGILESLPAVSPLSVMTLRRWLPGIGGVRDDKPGLFSKTPAADEEELSLNRRLSSGDWWRYYFAFTPPKNVPLPGFFEELFRLAGSSHERPQLAEKLLDQVTPDGFSSRTKFEQVLDKLTPQRLAGITPPQCRGLLWFFFEHGDELVSRYRGHGNWFAMYDIELDTVVDRLLKRLFSEDRPSTLDYLSERLRHGKAVYWTAIYLRHLVWQNGMAGNRPEPAESRVFADNELTQLCAIYCGRLEGCELRGQFAQFDDLPGFIFAWKDISTTAAVSTWMTSVTRDDESFLQTLLQLRYRGHSSATGYYRALHLSDIAEFLGGEETVTQRLDDIERSGNFPELVKQVRDSISLNR